MIRCMIRSMITFYALVLVYAIVLVYALEYDLR